MVTYPYSKRRGWDKYAKFDKQGGPQIPYVLFKSKNVTDPLVREEKMMKARPISPGTRHPMRKLLHYVGRAWSFLTARMPGEHFTINKCTDVPAFLDSAGRELRHLGTLKAEIWDIEGAYPNCPKQSIRFAMRKVIKDIRTERDDAYGVYVPRYSDAQPCMFDTRKRGYQFIPFQVMLDVADFSLDFAMIRMPDGRILRQLKGIPMGDPLSPGMMLSACAWMEKEWSEALAPADKQFFRAKRFMDDILLAYVETPRWDSARFVEDMQRSVIYQEPLKLERGHDGTFLETRFTIENNAFRYKLKNDNEGGVVKIWRYMHFHANAPFVQKRATLTACLRKVHRMASDTDILRVSALDKVAEFRRLRYPLGLLRKACAYLAATSGVRQWLDVRDTLR